MTSFTIIPRQDIEALLITNNRFIPEDNLKTYLAAWNLIKYQKIHLSSVFYI